MGGLPEQLQKKVEPEQSLPHRLVLKNQIFMKNPIEANKRAIHKEMQKARAISPDGIVGFNLMVAMNDYETYVHEVIAAGADFIVSGAGLLQICLRIQQTAILRLPRLYPHRNPLMSF